MELDLTQLLHLIEEMPAYRQLTGELKQQNGNTGVAVLEAAKPYLIAALYQNLRKPMLVVTAQPENSKKLQEQLSTWCDSSQVKLFPEPDAFPYQRIASDTSTELERIQVLSALVSNGDNAPLIVASAPALMQKTALYRDFTANCHTIKQGMDIEPFKLLGRWQAMGYRLENVVEVPGTISHRGGIIDIYPPTSNLPARLEFFGNTVDSIRLFDPADQRSLTAVASIAIVPATEILTPLLNNKSELEPVLDNLDLSRCNPEVSQQFKQELTLLLNNQRPDNMQFYAPLFNQDSILSYLPQDALIVLDEPVNIRQATEDLDARAEELRAEKLGGGELPGNFPRPYLTWHELEPGMRSRQRLTLTAWGSAEDEQTHRLDFAPATTYAGQLPVFIKKTRQLLNQKHRLVIISHQASRLSELLDEEDIIAPPLTEIKQIPPPRSLTLLQGSLAEGWTMNNDTHLLTDAEIFGFVKQRRLIKKHPVPHHKLFIDMAPGDYVVHIEHGIARFVGVITMSADNTEKEYLVLQYAAGDKLYVPTDQIDRVSRYVGAVEKPLALSRLGTQEWTRAKQRVKKAVEDIAQGLLELYSAREVVPGFTFSRDTVWQQELEASFPYVETPDQIEVLKQVKGDMEKDKPMDRLVCGDVGYGKTEVAIRAAFKAVMDGKQVAVLVPTTVLAQQHFATFSQRMDAFPVRIEVLSRFRTPKEQQAIIDGLANGSVDICIGTHRLLQKDVTFKDLGLLIIDEEQRFGVAHKEHLKQMRQEVDVLTLSATPIPRTLHMSLVGVRDMSTMETPPEERLPIKTYVAEYDDHLIREAVLRELEGNGQVFFVHNRVQSIGYVADNLRSLVPEARISVAHGQMPEAELERVMADFTRSRSDVLICTTIIESGLDIPNVNTLIVNRADKFGLTQLYQLRGRVGRGDNPAYAHFLFDRGKRLTPIAEKRLRTIFEATELGSGFGIAMKDLEIRGAGTLLGAKQSGHITAVGFNLYCRLLAEAVEELKAKRAGVQATKPPPLPPPTIDLPLAAYLPEEYVSDVETRLSLYHKLVKLDEAEQIEDAAREFSDRFGALPPEVRNLLYALRIKILAAKAGIESISTEDRQIVLRLLEGLRFDKQKLGPFFKDGIRIGTARLSLSTKRPGKEWQRMLEEVLVRIG